MRHTLGGYREYDPTPPLERFAESLWIHRAPDELPRGTERCTGPLPDPALSLAFYCRRQSDGLPIEPRLIVIGPKTRPHIFAFRGGHEIAAVRVKLEWLGLEEVRRKVPAWTGAKQDADWDYIRRTVIERAWRGVRGQG